MTLAIRRYLYIFFITAFVIITTIVITYANGYSLLSGSKILVKTGMLIVNTEPRGAKIILNSKVQEKLFSLSGNNTITTPAKIKNLTPGEYIVRFELPGYNLWQKKLTVLPGQATFAETVILFRKDKPFPISDLDINGFELSPDKKFIAISSEDKLQILDASNNEILYQQASSSQKMDWSQNSELLLLSDGRILNLKNQDAVTSISSDNSDKSTRWLDDNRLGSINGNRLNIYRINDNSTQTLELSRLEKSIFSDFFNDGSSLLTVVTSGATSDLIIYDSIGLQILQKIKLPGAGYSILETHNKYIALENKEFSNLIIIDPSSNQPLVAKLNNFKKLTWADANNIYYSSSHELFSLNLNQGKSEILARISQPINELFLHPSKNYLLFSTKDSINYLELDDRDHHNINTLVSADSLIEARFDSASLQFYYIGKSAASSTLYRFSTK